MEQEELDSIIEPGSFESWENARKFAELLPPVNSLFSGCVRMLWPAGASFTPGELVRRFPFDAIYKNASVKALLYYAAVALKRHDPAEDNQLNGLRLADVFDYRELCAILMISYLDSAIRKLTDPIIWKTTSSEIDLHTQVGAMIGETIPAIGTGCAMLVAAFRLYAMALYAKHDLRGYKAYMRQLHQNELLFDLRYEESKWGCNHLQTGAILLQLCGFGVGASSGLLYGSDVAHLLRVEGISDEMQAWSHGRQWLEALLQRENAPAGIDENGRFFPSPDALKGLQGQIDAISTTKSSFDWRHKRRESLDPRMLGKLALLSE